MPIQVPGNPFEGGVATNDVHGLSLVAKKTSKYDKYALLSGLAQGTAQLVQKNMRETEIAQAKEAVNNLEQIRQERENDPERGWKQTRGKNALERESGKSLLEEVEEGWDQDVAEAMKGVKAKWARERVAEYAKSAKEAQRKAINQHVLRQNEVYQDAVADQTFTTAQQMVMADDPKTVAQGIALAETTCQELEARKGIPVDRTKFVGPMHETVVGRMVQAGRLSEARAYIKKNRGQISPAGLKRLDAAIETRKASAEIESMVARDAKTTSPAEDKRSPNQVIVELRANNPKASAEQIQTVAAKIVANRLQVQAAEQREREAEVGYAYEHVRNGGSLSDFPYFEHMTEEERAAAQAYENKLKTGSLVTDSALFYRLSNDETLGRISWPDLYAQRQYFTDKDFDFLVARKQTLANDGRSKALPQTFATAAKMPAPAALKIDAAVRDALVNNGYVAKNKLEEKLYGRATLVLNQVIEREAREAGITPEQLPEFVRKRTDQLLKTKFSFSGATLSWLPRWAGGDYEASLADLASGKESLHIDSDLEDILDAGADAAGIGMPDDNSRFEQLLSITLMPRDPIPGAVEMAQAIYTKDRSAYEDIVKQATELNGSAPTPSFIVRVYLAHKYARTGAVSRAQRTTSQEGKQ